MNDYEKLCREHEKLNQQKHDQLIRIKAEASWIVRHYDAGTLESTDLAETVKRFKQVLQQLEDLDSKIDGVLEDKTNMLKKRKT